MEEWWLKAAIFNDKIVADLLLHLKDSSPSPSSSYSFLCKYLPPSWGLRQLRSKPSTSSLSEINKLECRRSPTTPLSWSPSQHSDSPPPHLPSSKITAISDRLTTSSKSTKRKKSFAQLKEDENSLLKEQTYLKQELATLRVTMEDQLSINAKLKRIKLDLQVESGIKPEGSYEASSSSVYKPVKTKDASSDSYLEQKGASSQTPVFVLPDLNMSPNEECGQV